MLGCLCHLRTTELVSLNKEKVVAFVFFFLSLVPPLVILPFVRLVNFFHVIIKNQRHNFQELLLFLALLRSAFPS